MESRTASEQGLFSQTYAELRHLAARMLGPKGGATLPPTALVHEAWLRLEHAGSEPVDRAHFVRVAASAMRCVIVDAARARNAVKRGAGHRITLREEELAAASPASLLAISECLERLAGFDPHLVQIVELRFFAGLTHPEIAANLGVPLRSVERAWQLARSWLARELASHREV